MRLPVRLPQFGESAAEATVVAWLAQPGATVTAEQEIVEVQTEKALMTVAAPVAGSLAEHAAEPGTILAVGDVLAWIEAVETPETPRTLGRPPRPAAQAPNKAGQPAGAGGASGGVPSDVHAIGTAPQASLSLDTHRRSSGSRLIRSAGENRKSTGTGRLAERASLRAAAGDAGFVSPRVWSVLQEHGLKVSDLATVPGTGAGGRITARDVEHYVSQGEAMSPVRQAVANAMSRSWSRPLATVARPVRCDALLTHRRTVEGRPSLTIYGMRALALALAKGSPFACRLNGARLLKPSTIDLAVAVEFNDGVLTPVVRRVEQLSLAELTAVVEEVIAKARTGRIADAGDAVASVSNYGVFHITWATPIPLPGQGLILGLGAVRSAPDWNPATKSWDRCSEAEVTLTFDHRIADGGAAGRVLHDIVDLLENPEKM